MYNNDIDYINLRPAKHQQYKSREEGEAAGLFRAEKWKKGISVKI